MKEFTAKGYFMCTDGRKSSDVKLPGKSGLEKRLKRKQERKAKKKQKVEKYQVPVESKKQFKIQLIKCEPETSSEDEEVQSQPDLSKFHRDSQT
jgi:hypothetical protein